MQFSIVSYLDPQATAQVRGLQRTISEVTGSHASLSSWEPHVTIGDGVAVDDTERTRLVGETQQLADETSAFELHMSGFSSLDNRPIGIGEVSTPYVLFVDVQVNPQLLDIVDRMQVITDKYTAWYHMPQPYLPHVTLAFRDLTREGFERGLDYLSDKDIRITSVIDHIALVEKLETKDVEYTRIPLETR